MPTLGKKEKLRTGRKVRLPLITRNSESGVWPPTEWKPLEKCPQIEVGILDLKTYELDLQQFDDDPHIRTFLHQLRDNRGYELEVNAPKRVCVDLYLVDRPFWGTDPKMMKKLEFVTEQINALAEKHGEEYEVVEPVRLVASLFYRCDLYTFNVRQVVPEKENDDDALKTVQAMVRTRRGHDTYELLEWRFRPGPPQTPPQPEPEPPLQTSSSDLVYPT